MRSRHVSLAPSERQQPPETPHVGGGQRKARISPPEFRRDQVNRHVMTADGDNSGVDGFEGTQELDIHLLSGVHSLAESRDGNDPVRPHQRHHHPRASLNRRGNRPLTDATQPYAKVLVLTKRGVDLPAHDRTGPLSRNTHDAQQPLNQWPEELLTGDRRRDRITGNAEHRLRIDNAKHQRVPRLNGHPVNDQLSKARYHLRCVVLLPCR